MPPDAPPAEDEVLDSLIVGAGPGGLTAGLYLHRFHRRVLLADAGHSRALGIDRTHNYPGFPDGIPGPLLLARLREQLAGVGGTIMPGSIRSLAKGAGGGFEADLDGCRLRARTVVLATGVEDAVPGLPGLDAVRRAALVRQCPICDGHEYRDRRIGVLGQGVHAAREAALIAHYSGAVVQIPTEPGAPGDESSGAPRQQHAREGVHAVAAALGPGGEVLLLLADGRRLELDVLYAALGSRPRSELARGLGARLDERGAIVVDEHCRTRVPGLYAVGDVVSALDQIAVATGHGAIAATTIHNSLPPAAWRPPPRGLRTRPGAL